jgi:hypothetical protein
MNLQKLLKDENFSIFFSIILGIGIVCILYPVCSGKDCGTIVKPPSEKDFDQYVYRMGEKCYEFKTEVVECVSGAIEAFEVQPMRRTPIVGK